MPTRAQTIAPPAASDVTVVVDRSGSMASCGTAINEGVGEIIQKHAENSRKMPGTPYTLRIVSFDNRVKILYTGAVTDLLEADSDVLDATKMKPIYEGLIPRGTTRLIQTLSEELDSQKTRIDAIRASWHRSVRDLNPRIAATIAVLTDGMDNVGGDLAHLLKQVENHQTHLDATCQFVAANQNAQETGGRYGFKPELCLQMDADPVHARAAMNSLAASSARAVSGMDPTFSGVERLTSSITPFIDNSSWAPSFPLQAMPTRN